MGISIGQAIYPADGTDVRRLLGVADGRMYVDKSQRKRQGAGMTSEERDTSLAPPGEPGGRPHESSQEGRVARAEPRAYSYEPR